MNDVFHHITHIALIASVIGAGAFVTGHLLVTMALRRNGFKRAQAQLYGQITTAILIMAGFSLLFLSQ